MARSSLILALAVLVGSCAFEPGPPLVEELPAPAPTVDAFATYPIDQFVAAGRTPAALRDLAADLAPLRDGPRAIAEDAELRLLALAAPIVEAVRMLPLDEQVAQLATTVWPVLLERSLDAPAHGTLAPQDGEAPSAYLIRLCAGPLAASCHEATPALAVRAIAMQRADERMRDALARCTVCDVSDGWHAQAWTWESLAREARIALR